MQQGVSEASPLACHYIKFIVVCACMRVCVMGGQRKQFDPEAEDAVSLAIDQQRLQLGDLCERQSWH